MRMKIEVPKSDVVLMYKAFSEVKEKFNKELTYAISFTKKSITNEATALIESMEPSDKYKEYEVKRNEIVEDCSQKDENGHIEYTNGSRGVLIQKNRVAECQSRLKELDTEYNDILIERDKDIESFKDILNEKTEIEVESIDWESIPSDGISNDLMDVLIPLIKKEE